MTSRPLLPTSTAATRATPAVCAPGSANGLSSRRPRRQHRLVKPGTAPDRAQDQPPDDLPTDSDAKAKQTLFQLLDEFLELAGEDDGLHRIYAAHEQWRTAHAEHGCQAADGPGCPRVDRPWAKSHQL